MMKLAKYNSTIIVFTLILSLTLLAFQRVAIVYATPNFPFEDIIAEIRNISPEDNGPYTGDVSLNINIRFYAYSYDPNSSLVPYQDINCIYQLDNSEWKNASSSR